MPTFRALVSKTALPGLFLLLVTAVSTAWPRAGIGERAVYPINGRLDGRADVSGVCEFALEGGGMHVRVEPYPGGPFDARGTREELDLLFVSFWSFEGGLTPTVGDAEVTGSGIRLLFGLLVFGTVEGDGHSISFSGVFDSVEAAAR